MKDKKNRNRKAIADETIKPKLIDMLEIPAGIVAGATQIELSGNREALVDGCQGVLEYDEGIIKLIASGMSIKFTGRNLQIRVLTHTTAVVAGFITGVEFIT